MKVEFWSTSFAAPKPPNRNLLIKLIGNYPPIPLLVGKRFVYFLIPSHPRLPPSLSSLCTTAGRRTPSAPPSWSARSLDVDQAPSVPSRCRGSANPVRAERCPLRCSRTCLSTGSGFLPSTSRIF
jgi:hypothetical protein